jgi:hypothetical protein
VGDTMSNKIPLYISLVGIAIGFCMIGSILYIQSIFVLISGIIVLMVSIVFMMITSTVDLFKRDKNIDINELKKQGFTVVSCVKCNKNNVLEDKYCIFCGEMLENSNE